MPIYFAECQVKPGCVIIYNNPDNANKVPDKNYTLTEKETLYTKEGYRKGFVMFKEQWQLNRLDNTIT